MRKKTFKRLENWVEILTSIEANIPRFDTEFDPFRNAILNLRDDMQELFDKRMERWKRKHLGQTKKEYDNG